MKGIIIVLGSMNDQEGNLSPNSKNRNDRAILELKKHPDYKILLTGGFGKHFNTTDTPHYVYAKKYLLSKGINEDNIIEEMVESGNTAEDAYLSMPILEKYKPEKVFISTSNFHLPKTKFIFEKVLKDYKLYFLGSEEDTDKKRLDELIAHEKEVLRKMKENGIYVEINGAKKWLWRAKKS